MKYLIPLYVLIIIAIYYNKKNNITTESLINNEFIYDNNNNTCELHKTYYIMQYDNSWVSLDFIYNTNTENIDLFCNNYFLIKKDIKTISEYNDIINKFKLK